MESGTNNRIRVVWLCHFSNKRIKEYFNTPEVHEKSPWISNLIEVFEEINDVDLHIVAPNIFTNKRVDICIKNINYHFYRYYPSYIPRKIYRFSHLDQLTNYRRIKNRIKDIITKINPRIIHLHGAENPYYSAGILPLIDQYPTFVTIQGFVRNASTNDYVTKKRIEIEEEILKRTKHVGVRTKEMSEIAKTLNENVQLHFHKYTMSTPAFIKDISLQSAFDIIFFARVVKDKGIEDLLKALALVKEEIPEVSLRVFGSSYPSYIEYLQEMSKQLNIEHNVKFMGFMDSQEDIYKEAIKAKICVLPTYHDIIPGTIIESMFIRLPVIAYDVGGIPELNEKGQAIVLVEKNNIPQLAAEIIDLLKNESRRNLLADYAYSSIRERITSRDTTKDIIRAYHEILSE